MAGHAQHHTWLIEKAEDRTAEIEKEQGHIALVARAEVRKALVE